MAQQRLKTLQDVKQAQLEAEFFIVLYTHCQEIMHAFQLDVDEILNVPLERKKEIWNQYVEYEQRQQAEIDAKLQQLLSFSPQQLLGGTS